jgi:hypothetical protein
MRASFVKSSADGVCERCRLAEGSQSDPLRRRLSEKSSTGTSDSKGTINLALHADPAAGNYSQGFETALIRFLAISFDDCFQVARLEQL